MTEPARQELIAIARDVSAAHGLARRALGFEVTDNGFDGGTAFHLAFDCGCDVSDLTADKHDCLVDPVAFVALIDMSSAHTNAHVLFDIPDGTVQSVTVAWIIVQSLRMQHELTAPEPGLQAWQLKLCGKSFWRLSSG